jgi:hypothetical protein
MVRVLIRMPLAPPAVATHLAIGSLRAQPVTLATTERSPEAKKWGQEQGNAAVQAWYDNYYVGRYAIFGDVEGSAGSFGWVSNTTLNQSVWEGWFDSVNGANNGLLKAGVYSAADAWSNIMDSNYNLNGSTPEWSYEPQNGCESACPTATTFDAQGFGSEYPVIWQYAQNCGSYGDLDCATTLPD